MTDRRTRHRPLRNRSALAGIKSWESPRDQLNAAAPDPDRCAWPNCHEPLEIELPGNGERVPHRYGVLCNTHAVDVAVAVIQQESELNRVRQFFEQQATELTDRRAAARREEEQYESEQAELRRHSPGFVYYLRVGERIKVGHSVDVKRRMRAYPPGCQLLAVEPGDRQLELRRHRQFVASRTDGREWFRPTPDLLELVREIVGIHGDPNRFAHHYRKNEHPVRLTRTA